MSGAPWNTTETARLRVWALAGLNLSEIATKMERSKTGIHVRAELNIAIAKSPHPKQRRMRLEIARVRRVELGLKAKSKPQWPRHRNDPNRIHGPSIVS
jgi:hypothetical protein